MKQFVWDLSILNVNMHCLHYASSVSIYCLAAVRNRKIMRLPTHRLMRQSILFYRESSFQDLHDVIKLFVVLLFVYLKRFMHNTILLLLNLVFVTLDIYVDKRSWRTIMTEDEFVFVVYVYTTSPCQYCEKCVTWIGHRLECLWFLLY